MTGDIVIANDLAFSREAEGRGGRQSMASAARTRAVAGSHPEGWRHQRPLDRHGLRPRDDV